MFTVLIDSQQAFAPISKSFVSVDDAVRCYNANKGEGINLQLIAPNGDVLESCKTW